MQSRTNASLCSLIETDDAGCAGPAPAALANRQPSSRRKSTTLVECSVPLLGSRARSAEKSSPEGRTSGRATYSSSRFCVVEAISSAPPPEERGHVATDSLCPTVCCDLTFVRRHSSSSLSRRQRGPSRRCTTMPAVDSTSPEVSSRTCGIVS